MTVSVGVIGTGMIGTEHVRRLAGEVAGSSVASVFDVATDRAAALAQEVGARAAGSWIALVEDPGVDAVLIASPGDLHAEQVLACLAAGKPVLCEKPLATTADDALKVVDAEVAAGRRLRAGRVHAPLRRGVPRRQGGDRRRCDRRAPARPRGAPQPLGAGHLRRRDVADRLPGPRVRHLPLALRAGDHRDDRGAGPAAARSARSTCATRRSCCSSSRTGRSSTRSRSSTASTATTSAARSSAPPARSPSTTRGPRCCSADGRRGRGGAAGLAGALRPGLPGRAAGLDRRARGRGDGRARRLGRLGRLRRHRGGGDRRRLVRAARAHRGPAGRPARRSTRREDRP